MMEDLDGETSTTGFCLEVNQWWDPQDRKSGNMFR